MYNNGRNSALPFVSDDAIALHQPCADTGNPGATTPPLVNAQMKDTTLSHPNPQTRQGMPVLRKAAPVGYSWKRAEWSNRRWGGGGCMARQGATQVASMRVFSWRWVSRPNGYVYVLCTNSSIRVFFVSRGWDFFSASPREFDGNRKQKPIVNIPRRRTASIEILGYRRKN